MSPRCSTFFFFNDTATTEIYTLSLHDALPISSPAPSVGGPRRGAAPAPLTRARAAPGPRANSENEAWHSKIYCGGVFPLSSRRPAGRRLFCPPGVPPPPRDRRPPPRRPPPPPPRARGVRP